MLPQLPLGKTDIRISRVGLGTVKLGRNQCVKYPEAFELPSDAHARQLLHCARDYGINLLDTAPAYGVSEERLGYLLRGERKEWVICTKAGEEFSRDYESTLGQNTGTTNFDFEATALRKSVERSLRRLRTDYIDIVLIHSDGNDEHLIHHHQVLHTLSELKRAGWIRAFGMSTKTIKGALLCAGQADVVMTTFDLNKECDIALMQSCAAQKTGVLLKKIFNSGHLFSSDSSHANDFLHSTDTLHSYDTLHSNDTLQSNGLSHSDGLLHSNDPLQANEKKNPSVNAIIEQQMTVIFAQSAVNSAIIGTLNCEHLRSNVQCALLGLAENGLLA
jgi:aryl-alcohol dehydrogenase-like predicted oxidoreductase